MKKTHNCCGNKDKKCHRNLHISSSAIKQRSKAKPFQSAVKSNFFPPPKMFVIFSPVREVTGTSCDGLDAKCPLIRESA